VSCPAGVARRTVGVSGILDHNEVVRLGESHQRPHVGHSPIEMFREDGAGGRGDAAACIVEIHEAAVGVSAYIASRFTSASGCTCARSGVLWLLR
jgi:hypothetical protein